MLKLRSYKPCDAQAIVSWLTDELAFRKWSADRYGAYPISPEDINEKYFDHNGDCAEPDNFYPLTAFDESGAVGHLIMRFTDPDKETLRFGFVIVDHTKRGMGYGKQMLRLALKYAFELLGAQKVTIGVFENNPSALHCYQSIGFQQIGESSFQIMDEQWRCIELEIVNEAKENRRGYFPGGQTVE